MELEYSRSRINKTCTKHTAHTFSTRRYKSQKKMKKRNIVRPLLTHTPHSSQDKEVKFYNGNVLYYSAANSYYTNSVTSTSDEGLRTNADLPTYGHLNSRNLLLRLSDSKRRPCNLNVMRF